MQWLAVALAAVVVSLTLLPMLRHEAWWIRVLDFPRLQIAVVTMVAILAYATMAGLDDALDLTMVTALTGCLAYQIARIAAYTRLHPKQAKDTLEVDPRRCVSLLVANVLTPNRNAGRLLEIIAEQNPDVVLFVETDEWWQEQLDVLEASRPYSVKHPSDNLYGMHLYSRLELIEPQLKFLVQSDIPSIHAGLRLPNGQCVQLHCMHPTPPSPTENTESTERDAELLVVARAVAKAEVPAIVLGDLNDVAWSSTTRLFQKISGMLDPRIGRGLFSTFHASYPFLRWPLDHVFFSSDFTVLTMHRLPAFGSDHFPICISLCHTPKAEAIHEEPQPDADDRMRAKEKIESADVKQELQPIDSSGKPHPTPISPGMQHQGAHR